MKKSIITIMVLGICYLLGACAESIATPQMNKKAAQYKNHVTVRLTYYHRHEDKYGNKVAIGGRAKEGVTIAVRRKLMELGRTCFIPQFVNLLGTGHVRVEDRGRNVEKLKASKKKCEVADVYLECRNRKEFIRRVDYFEHRIGQYADLFF